LLDCRYLAGDLELFTKLRDRLIPEMMAQESQVSSWDTWRILRGLATANSGHCLSSRTEREGRSWRLSGLHLACRLALMSENGGRAWLALAGHDTSLRRSKCARSALQFLLRCAAFSIFATDRMTTSSLGPRKMRRRLRESAPPGWTSRIPPSGCESTSDMRAQLTGFRTAAGGDARGQSLFYRQLETWRTGFSDSDFSVVDGLIFLQPPGISPTRSSCSARFG